MERLTARLPSECQEFCLAYSNRYGRILPVRYDDVGPADYRKLFGGDVLGYNFFGTTRSGRAVNELEIDSNEFNDGLLTLRNDFADPMEKLVGQSRGIGVERRAPDPAADESTPSIHDEQLESCSPATTVTGIRFACCGTSPEHSCPAWSAGLP